MSLASASLRCICDQRLDCSKDLELGREAERDLVRQGHTAGWTFNDARNAVMMHVYLNVLITVR